jgi:hypothetical protein
MGIKSWRSMSALVFAGVALIGCNNGAQKDPRPAPVGTAQSNQAPFSTAQFPTAQKQITPTAGTGGLPPANQPTGAGTQTGNTPFNPGTMPGPTNLPPLPPGPGSNVNPATINPSLPAGSQTFMPPSTPSGLGAQPASAWGTAPNNSGPIPVPPPSNGAYMPPNSPNYPR